MQDLSLHLLHGECVHTHTIIVGCTTAENECTENWECCPNLECKQDGDNSEKKYCTEECKQEGKERANECIIPEDNDSTH